MAPVVWHPYPQFHFVSPADDGACRVQSQEQNISFPYSGDLISELDSSPRFLRKSFNVAEEHGMQANCPQNDVKEEAVWLNYMM